MNKIDEVIETFPFEEVQKYMYATNWRWMNWDKGIEGVPTIEDLKSTARELLALVLTSEYKNESTSCSTGGLVVDKFLWDSNIELRLSFVPWHKHTFFKEKEI